MGEIAGSRGGRPGAPWGALKGGTPEANDLARVMREWLDASGMRVREFHAKLQPEDFTGGRIPSVDTVYNRFAGIAPDWEFVSAVVHICSPDAVTMNQRQGEAQELWRKWVAAKRRGKTARSGVARRGDLVVEAPEGLGLPADASADQRLIAAYEKINQMYEARLIATESHHRLELLLYFMIGRENDHLQHIERLEQQLGSAMEQRTPDPAQIAGLRTMIEEAEVREGQLLRARDKAEAERDIAQQMLDHTNRTIRCLQEEIERIKVGPVSTETTAARIEDAFVSDLNDVDGALGQIQRILEEEHDQLHRLRHRLGWRLVSGDATSDGHVIVGQVVDPVGREVPTTPDNPATRQLGAPTTRRHPTTRPPGSWGLRQPEGTRQPGHRPGVTRTAAARRPPGAAHQAGHRLRQRHGRAQGPYGGAVHCALHRPRVDRRVVDRRRQHLHGDSPRQRLAAERDPQRSGGPRPARVLPDQGEAGRQTRNDAGASLGG
ncbi:hypothetical protein [Streptomyces lavendulocolor]|uniref:hypothetical protein n=1 Tax=Streptomyces lavendulocolor TaxID=67316 RepID=UPI003C2CE428